MEELGIAIQYLKASQRTDRERWARWEYDVLFTCRSWLKAGELLCLVFAS